MEKFSFHVFKRKNDFKGWSFYFDRHPVMTSFYSLITFGFGTLVAVSILEIFLFIFESIVGTNISPPFPLPVPLDPKTLGIVQNHKAFIESITSLVTFFKVPNIIAIFMHCYFLILLISVTSFIYFFRKIIFSALEDNPFDKQNVNRLRIVGLILIITPLILHFLYAMNISLIISNHLLNTKIRPGVFSLNSNMFAEYLSFIFGAFTLLLAAVFKLGIKLREEQELTI